MISNRVVEYGACGKSLVFSGLDLATVEFLFAHTGGQSHVSLDPPWMICFGGDAKNKEGSNNPSQLSKQDLNRISVPV